MTFPVEACNIMMTFQGQRGGIKCDGLFAGGESLCLLVSQCTNRRAAAPPTYTLKGFPSSPSFIWSFVFCQVNVCLREMYSSLFGCHRERATDLTIHLSVCRFVLYSLFCSRTYIKTTCIMHAVNAKDCSCTAWKPSSSISINATVHYRPAKTVSMVLSNLMAYTCALWLLHFHCTMTGKVECHSWSLSPLLS